MKLAKSIDELYDEVKDFDIVLCNDAPLATALNNRISKPFVGEFAVTPRQLAGDLGSLILKGPLLDDIDVVRKISERTGYTLRFVHGEISNIQRIRRYTKDVSAHLHGRSKKVYDEYVNLRTTDKAMENFDGEHNPIFKDKKVAVIGTELFDELDKYVNPKFGTFEEISLFKRGTYTIPEIRIVGNNREISENIVSLITPENCRDVAIVMDVGSNLAASIKSALYKKNLPFINKLVVKDIKQTRDFLEFIALSLSFDYLKVSQIREIVACYDGFIKPRYDNYLVKDFDLELDEKTRKLLGLMKNIRNYTFNEVRDKIIVSSQKGQVKLLLDEVGVLDKMISNDTADDLFYAVNNINDLKHNEQIPAHEKEGVLLVDCINSVYIDRPIVIYAGMGPEWEKDISFLNEIDYRMKDDEVDRNVMRFQVLLQQGEKRLYAVNSIKDGTVATPCSYFDHCSERKICENFGDVCEKAVDGPWVRPAVPNKNQHEHGETEKEDDNFVISNSTFSSFVSCPRGFMFGRLLDDPDNEYTITGEYLHQYAEFRAAYPDEALKHDVEYYVDFISDRCLNLYSPERRVLERSMLRASITNINEFLDSIELTITFNDGNTKENPNPFFDGLLTSDQTERKLSVSNERIEGVIDLIGDEGIYDYKSGKVKSGIDITKAMSTNAGIICRRNFQPLFYHYIMERNMSRSFDKFGFYFTSGNLNNFTKGVRSGRFDKNNLRMVYLFNTMEDFFRDHYVDNILFSDPKYSDSSHCRDRLISVLSDFGLSDPEALKENKDLAAKVMDDRKEGKRLLNHISTDFKDYKNKLAKFGSFYDGNEVFITPETLSGFVRDLAVAKARYMEYLYSSFPAVPLMECKKCNFCDVCTAISLEGGEENFQSE